MYNLKHFIIHALPATLTLAVSGIVLASSPPEAPTSISVSAHSNGTVVIYWNQSYDSDGWITGYDLLKDSTVIHVGNRTSYTDTNIRSGETYHYSVVAIDNNGNRSLVSSVASTTIIANGATIGSYDLQAESGSQVDVTCVDHDGDGWGWNGFESCSMTTVSSNNNIEPPDSLPFHECVDDDGDGWGWDGSQSCNMDVSITTTETTGCFTANAKQPGWTEIEFCFVETSNGNVSISASEEICVDRDGDGYGWNGFATCDPTPRYSTK